MKWKTVPLRLECECEYREIHCFGGEGILFLLGRQDRIPVGFRWRRFKSQINYVFTEYINVLSTEEEFVDRRYLEAPVEISALPCPPNLCGVDSLDRKTTITMHVHLLSLSRLGRKYLCSST